MFNTKSDQVVEELVKLEFDQARRQWGETYNSIDIADEVLHEEIQESLVEFMGVKNIYLRWLENLAGKTDGQTDIIGALELCAKNGIKELAQVCAVCEKIKHSF